MLDVIIVGLFVFLMVLSLFVLWEERRDMKVMRLLSEYRNDQYSFVTPSSSVLYMRHGWWSRFLYRMHLSPMIVISGNVLFFAAGIAVILIAGFGVFLIFLVISLFLLNVLINIRRETVAVRFCQAMPAFLDTMRRHVLIGAPPGTAFQRAAALAPPVLRWVFAPIERRLAAGADLVGTLQWAARHYGGEVMPALAAAVTAASRFGRGLANTLEHLAETERNREQLRRELRSATSEIRASSSILAILPLMVGLWFIFSVPQFREFFYDWERSGVFLTIASILYLIGVFLLWRISRIPF